MDEFMEAVHDVFPEMVVQFEDFESEKAFNYLDKYRNQYKCFVSLPPLRLFDYKLIRWFRTTISRELELSSWAGKFTLLHHLWGQYD